jgi:GntR family transcriptional regulator/MocR family aminotransferase
VVTAGAQNAFELIARALAKPGDHVAVESPGYKYAHRAFSAAGLTLVEVPVDGQGLVVEALERLAVKPRLIYVTPAHQQPTGVVLSASRRLALLDYARQSNSWIVEDDYDSEFRYAASPLSVLQSLDAHGRVILVSSFSKTMFPAVRLGFVSVPHPPALQAVARELDSSLRFVSPLEQKAMALFISEGHYARHLRAMRRCYAERRDHLRRLLEGPAGRRIREVLDLQWPHTGFAAIGWFRQPRAELKALVLAGQSRGLELVATSATAQQRQGLLLGFGAIPDDRMADAVARLSAVL